MTFNDIKKFQLKRINAFQGLVIDTDTWQDAHDYHRNQHRLHLLAFHGTGIVQGLKVAGNEPPDLSVTIEPGLAIDPEGNSIIVAEAQPYHIQTNQKGTIYLIIQFREIPTEPYQPSENGQATRLLEAYRIQERDKLPDEPYVELARIDFDPTKSVIKGAENPASPGENEINLNFREEIVKVTPAAPAAPAVTAAPKKATTPVAEVPSPSQEKITLGHAVLGDAEKNLHIEGLQNLISNVNNQSKFVAELTGSISLNKDINSYTMIFLSGKSGFELTEEQQGALSSFLESGGVIFGEGCTEEQGEEQSKGAKEFGLAFNKLASQLNCKLETVQRGHVLLSSPHVFATIPPGAEPSGMLLHGGNMIYSASDYCCAWQGGHQGNPLPRDVIRTSFEIGANIITYAHTVKTARR